MELMVNGITNLRVLCFFFLWILHGGSPSSFVPPQRRLFPVIDIALTFRNNPSYGTSPSRLLNDKFRSCRRVKFCRYFGIWPDKLFLPRSRSWRLFKALREEGMLPSNRLFPRSRRSSIMHFPNVGGMTPENLLSETSNSTRLLILPSSWGSGPFKRFLAKLNEMDIKGRVTTSAGIVPVRLLLDRLSVSRRWQLPILEGILPCKLFSCKSSLVNWLMFPNEGELLQRFCCGRGWFLLRREAFQCFQESHL